MVLLGQRLLPTRRTGTPPVDIDEWAGGLVQADGLGVRLFRLRVRQGSALAGETLATAGLGSEYGLTVLVVEPAASAREKRQRCRKRSTQN